MDNHRAVPPKPLPQGGFSLIELMVAMTVTLIISGTMYAFITQSGNAFSREPSLSDRQQQIRLAMDRIQQDVLMAGLNVGRNFQVFTSGLDGAGAFVGVTAGQNTDILEMRAQRTNCPQVRICPKDGASYASSQDCKPNSTPVTGANLNFVEPVPACYPEPGFALVLYGDGNAKFGWGHNVHSGGDKFNFPPGQQPPTSQIDDGQADLKCSLAAGPGTGGACPAANDCDSNTDACPYAIATMAQVRYQIANDPTDGAPALFRSDTGGLADDGSMGYVVSAPPGAAWQLIARGIEDMQVRYRTRNPAVSGAGFWSTEPPAVANSDMIVREVEITLWARAMGVRNLAGQTTAANNVNAVRGSMTMRVSPRPALDYLLGAASNRWQ